MRYNNKLSTTRFLIENTFALLKGRFRKLKFVDAKVERISDIVTACCVLHNIALDFPEEEAALLREGPLPLEENLNPVANIALPHDIEGSEKRTFISTLL